MMAAIVSQNSVVKMVAGSFLQCVASPLGVTKSTTHIKLIVKTQVLPLKCFAFESESEPKTNANIVINTFYKKCSYNFIDSQIRELYSYFNRRKMSRAELTFLKKLQIKIYLKLTFL